MCIRDRSAAWKNVRAQVLHAPQGVHALHVSLQGGADVEVDWLGFDALPWEKGAFETHQYRNLFAEMGYKQADIDKKVNEVFNDCLLYTSVMFRKVIVT